MDAQGRSGCLNPGSGGVGMFQWGGGEHTVEMRVNLPPIKTQAPEEGFPLAPSLSGAGGLASYSESCFKPF